MAKTNKGQHNMHRFLGIILFTVVEAFGIIYWQVKVSAEQALLGVTVLALTFAIEHLFAFRVLVGGEAPNKKLLGISASETLIWIVWLALTGINGFLALAFLLVTMFVQHSVERNIFQNKPLFDKLFKREIVVFTAVEAVGAGIWLVLLNQGFVVLGNLVLVTALTVEHFLQAEA